MKIRIDDYIRLDILSYSYKPGQLPRTISVAKWDETANCIDNGSVISGDAGKIGR